MMVTKKRDLSHLTTEDIQEHASQGYTMIYDFGDTTIKHYSDNTIVKAGGGDKSRRRSEAAALRVTAQLGLPTPRLHEVEESKTDNNDDIMIKMDYIEGQTLGKIWPTFSTEEKRDICHQLRGILDKMRQAEWPGTSIGSCEGGPVFDSRLYGIKIGAPCRNEEELNKLILDIYDQTPQPMRETLIKHQRKDHRIVFSHGDLHQSNILVKDGKITALLDWELAGWYPEYWDYVKFCISGGEHRDWMDHAKDIFSEVYDEELLFQLALSRFQKG